VQETLLAIHTKRSSWDRAQLFTPWAYAVARYKLMDHFRRIGRRPMVALEDAGVLIADDNPEEGAVRRDVETLLAKLPARQRALIRDVKLAGLSMEEAAAKAGMTAGAAKVSVHRAMKALGQEVLGQDASGKEAAGED
jgi:RNA polymerase sigma-70 factor (ECF subfamily)